jgi:hypothetical protein
LLTTRRPLRAAAENQSERRSRSRPTCVPKIDDSHNCSWRQGPLCRGQLAPSTFRGHLPTAFNKATTTTSARLRSCRCLRRQSRYNSSSCHRPLVAHHRPFWHLEFNTALPYFKHSDYNLDNSALQLVPATCCIDMHGTTDLQRSPSPSTFQSLGTASTTVGTTPARVAGVLDISTQLISMTCYINIFIARDSFGSSDLQRLITNLFGFSSSPRRLRPRTTQAKCYL